MNTVRRLFLPVPHYPHSCVLVHEQCRLKSSASTSFSGNRYSAWEAEGYPENKASFPHSKPFFRKTHIEWWLHHGHGERLGKYGPSRELSDFEYDDGTPAPISLRRYAYKHHQDHLLVQLIRAGAAVERYQADQRLPRIPGTKEQRDWDPEIPLFLDDLDERGQAPTPLQNPTKKLVEERFRSDRSTTPINVSRQLKDRRASDGAENESELEVNTMFASYDPKAFVQDEVPQTDYRRPYWSRRRWSLTDNFMVPVSPKPKNTIKDE